MVALIEKACVQVADFLRIRAHRRVGRRGFFENGFEIMLGAVFEQRERAVVGTIRRNGGVASAIGRSRNDRSRPAAEPSYRGSA